MKKTFLLTLLIAVSFTVSSQTWNLNASEYAYKVKNYGVWSGWTDWIDCDLLIQISPSYIVIHSNSRQAYAIKSLLSVNNSYTLWKWQCVDYRSVPCIIRFKIDSDGNQIYIDYSDASWVYNVTMRGY